MAFKVYERDPEAVAKAAAQYSSSEDTKKKSIEHYRFKPGKTTIRVMGPWNESEGVWYREFQEHQVQLGKRWLYSTCARQFGQGCVICDKGEEIYKLGGEENVKLAASFRPKRQFLINAIVLSDPEGDQRQKGIVPIKTGISVVRALLAFDAQALGDEGYGDITSLVHGFNISVELSSDKKYTVLPSRARTNIVELLAKDNINIENFSLNDLEVLLPPDSPDELRAALEGADRVPGFPVNPVPVRSAPRPQPVTPNVQMNTSVTTPTMPQRPDFND